MIPAWVLALLYLVGGVMVIQNRNLESTFRMARLFLGHAIFLWAGFYLWTTFWPPQTIEHYELRLLLTRWLHVPLATSLITFSWVRWRHQKSEE